MTGKQLKNSILQWAIQGKLVPQDPNDEPASVLLERIRVEKARLIKEGKIKKDKNETIIFRGDDNSHYEKLPNGEVRCIDSEIPFEIPENWCWVRVKMLGDVITGSTPPTEKKELYGSDYPFFKPTDLGQGLYTINSKDSVSILGFENSRKVTSGSVLITCIGATIGKTGLVRKDGICNQQINAIIPLPYFSFEYIYFACISSTFQEQIKRNASSTTLPILNKQKFETLLLPIPPFSEQQKIVAKLKEILPIIENYNTVQVKLDTLNGEINNLLKKSILQEAIQGRLVPQIDSEESATVLLEKIKEEKSRLVKEGKLKKKDLVETHIFKGDDNKYYEQIGKSIVCIDAEIPFEIPSSWCWCRLETLVTILDGYRKPISKAERKSGIYPYYGANGILDYVDDYILDGEFLLVGEDGSVVTPYGSPVVNKASGKIWVNNHAHVLQECGELGYYDYLYYALSTIKITQYIHGFMPKYSQGDLRKTLIPIPPIAEQHRIVVKIEESCGSL